LAAKIQAEKLEGTALTGGSLGSTNRKRDPILVQYPVDLKELQSIMIEKVLSA
jgi:hypothetical protein